MIYADWYKGIVFAKNALNKWNVLMLRALLIAGTV